MRSANPSRNPTLCATRRQVVVASASLIRPTPENRSTELRTSSRNRLDVAGGGCPRPACGSVMLEVNASRALAGTEVAIDQDIAGLVVELLDADTRPHESRTRGMG